MIDTQQTLTQAWDALQAVPSYVEQQAALFARSTTYEVYHVQGFCEKEWKLLGKIQVSSYSDLEAKIRDNWPDVTSILAIDCAIGAITSMNTVTRPASHPVAF